MSSRTRLRARFAALPLLGSLLAGMFLIAAQSVPASAGNASVQQSEATSAVTPLWPEAYYWIYARHSFAVLDIPGGILADTYGGHPRVPLQQWSNTTLDQQKFRPVYRYTDTQGQQWYTFHRKGWSEQCINGAPGKSLAMTVCPSWKAGEVIPNEFLFAASYASQGWWSWHGKYNQSNWDISHSSQENGAEVIQYAPTGELNQQFMLYYAESAPLFN